MNSAFDLKSARLDALVLRLMDADIENISQLLDKKKKQYKKFASMPLILDTSEIAEEALKNIPEIIGMFDDNGLPFAAWRDSRGQSAEMAKECGVFFLKEDKYLSANPVTENTGEDIQAAEEMSDRLPETENQETGVPDSQTVARRTVVVNTPVRTGQQVYAQQADLIVLGMVSEGAEVIADGNIHIYAPMRGRALAGESGDIHARIFIQSMQAELVSVAGVYRVLDQDLPPHLHRKPVQVELNSEGRLAIKSIDAR